jgi:hypothetical protein
VAKFQNDPSVQLRVARFKQIDKALREGSVDYVAAPYQTRILLNIEQCPETLDFHSCDGFHSLRQNAQLNTWKEHFEKELREASLFGVMERRILATVKIDQRGKTRLVVQKLKAISRAQYLKKWQPSQKAKPPFARRRTQQSRQFQFSPAPVEGRTSLLESVPPDRLAH